MTPPYKLPLQKSEPVPYPDEKQFIDVHTHHPWNYPHIFSIRNYVDRIEIETSRQLKTAISVGVHPWKCKPGEEEKFLELVKQASTLPHVLAIGECGIDLKIETPIEFQEKVFLQQALLADEIKKPLIIHCVKAYQQFSQLLQKQKPGVPWIFHGFNNTLQLAEELTGNGAYLSVGFDLLKENSKIRAAFYHLPIDQLFFETDEMQQPVWKLYAEAAKIFRISEKDLKKHVFENFERCFMRAESNIRSKQ